MVNGYNYPCSNMVFLVLATFIDCIVKSEHVAPMGVLNVISHDSYLE